MKKTTKGVIIAACGVTMLSGGVTLALWNDAELVPAGAIISGDFEITQYGESTWLDTSADVPGNPRSINAATFRLAPGDTVAMEQTIAVTADGNNLDAELTVTVPTLTGDLAAPDGVSADFTLLDSAGAAVPGATKIALGNPATVSIAESDTYSVRVDFAFDPAAGDQSQTVDTATLGEIVFLLEQVRP